MQTMIMFLTISSQTIVLVLNKSYVSCLIHHILCLDAERSGGRVTAAQVDAALAQLKVSLSAFPASLRTPGGSN